MVERQLADLIAAEQAPGASVPPPPAGVQAPEEPASAAPARVAQG
jgi:hypothetical protein